MGQGPQGWGRQGHVLQMGHGQALGLTAARLDALHAQVRALGLAP